MTSRQRAIVPSLSVGKSFSTGTTIDIDRGGTNDADRYIVGPSDYSKDLDFDLNWNLSDLIWNSAQTSIDSREKLMVELREDILNEATRLYYERKRAQMEFILQPPQEPLEQGNALIRIEELTALLDSLTGGYFSKETTKIYEQYPQLGDLWLIEISD